jgi:type I restriction enzyme, S subunit
MEVADKITVACYPTYKDSGIAWLGEIPKHWELTKFKRLFFEKKKIINVDMSCGSISFGKVIYKDDEKIPEITKKSYQVVSKGDFLVNPLNLNYDLVSLRIALSEIDVVVSSGYIVLNSDPEISKEYYKWLLHIFDIVFMKTLGSGVRQTLSWTHIATSELVFPPLREQTAIATFLNDKVAKIEKAIILQEKQIELLKERKIIILENAVTKGINPNVKFKYTGLRWLDKIPEHWEIIRSKRLFTQRKERARKSDEQLTASQKHGVIPQKMYMELEGRRVTQVEFNPEILKHVEKGDFVISMRSFQGGIEFCEYTGCVSSAYVPLIPQKEVEVSYYKYLLKCQKYINELSSTSNLVRDGQALRFDNFSQVDLLVIPLEEQKEIANYIDMHTLKIDTAITLKAQEIEKLKEYKVSLINSAVTGKVKVV